MISVETPGSKALSVAYFDTNILSYLAKNQQLWTKLSDFLNHNDVVIGISQGLIAELVDATRLHANLADLFVSVPTAILKPFEVVIEEEVEAHPERRSQSIINAIIDDADHALLHTTLASKSLAASREIQQDDAKQMSARLLQLKSNFPPSKSGKYTREQAEEFT